MLLLDSAKQYCTQQDDDLDHVARGKTKILKKWSLKRTRTVVVDSCQRLNRLNDEGRELCDFVAACWCHTANCHTHIQVQSSGATLCLLHDLILYISVSPRCCLRRLHPHLCTE